jgi:hypothetical protein
MTWCRECELSRPSQQDRATSPDMSTRRPGWRRGQHDRLGVMSIPSTSQPVRLTSISAVPPSTTPCPVAPRIRLDLQRRVRAENTMPRRGARATVRVAPRGRPNCRPYSRQSDASLARCRRDRRMASVRSEEFQSQENGNWVAERVAPRELRQQGKRAHHRHARPSAEPDIDSAQVARLP